MMSRIFIILLFAAGSHFDAQQLNYYFGNLHAHTGFSDGNKDSVSSGISTPKESYAYARMSLNFDFLGISEHNHYTASHSPGFKRPLYKTGLEMADAANEDGQFVALFGMEYGVSSNYHGHVLVYGMNQLLGWETSAPGVTGNNYDVYNGKDDYAGLFTKVKNTPLAFSYLAHPDFTDFSANGTSQQALAFYKYNAAFDSAIVGMPLRSGLATNAGDTYSDYPQSHYFNYYKRMLYHGYHLGIGYDHDNHYSNFGRGNGGRLVVLAPALTRANIISAIHQMRFYGSDDINARIRFDVNENVMGSVVSDSVYPVVKLVHDDPDGEMADTIRIWKGRRNSGGLWAEILQSDTDVNTAIYTDQDVVPGYEYFYFGEIRQKDGQWIVTSPVWFTPLEPLGFNSPDHKLEFTYYPNPVSRMLSVSFADRGATLLMIRDSLGKTFLQQDIHAQGANIDLSGLPAGVYQLEVRRGNAASTGKLVME